ncbi:BamA/TamA family outer membrane protein [Desulfovibrio inopinatus]|uniref:BamA/TamA family outer membrane protein n=1 Tax=Desulfovibrio inopinatus TaxID=102109 RepID=UPI00040AC615|nr:BamA/TamA family outer membrane protein [Desulfovibrio inopinatus]
MAGRKDNGSWGSCFWGIIVMFVVCIVPTTAMSQYMIHEDGEPEKSGRALALPYAFHSDSLDVAYGVAGGMSGYFQRQSSLAVAVLGSSNNSYAAYLLLNDFRIPFLDRLFFDVNASVGHYKEQRSYQLSPPGTLVGKAGTSTSSVQDYVKSSGWDNWGELRLQYVLPLGHGKDHIVSEYITQNGLLKSGASGGESWNPLETGKTTIELKPFYRARTFELPKGVTTNNTNGLEVALVYDNTDFKPSPSTGSLQRFALSRDFGLFDSSGSWTAIEGEVNRYFNLGEMTGLRQNVLALTAWSAYSLTWEERLVSGGKTFSHRPPEYMGATLGGKKRMRAYPDFRYNDRASIYYCAEWRIIPEWNPFSKIPLINLVTVDWWQPVLFVEAGNVARNWSVVDLHDDLKFDAGIGLRFMIEKAVVRVDVAAAPDSWGMWAMIGQTF